MNRGLWFVAGAVAGVYTVTRVRRTLEAFTPGGLRDRMAGLSLGAQLFAEEVRTEMAHREHDLRERLGVPDGPALPSATPPLPLALTRKGND